MEKVKFLIQRFPQGKTVNKEILILVTNHPLFKSLNEITHHSLYL